VTEETAKKIEFALKYAAKGWRVIWAHWPIGVGDKAKCSCGVSVLDDEGKETHAVGKHPGREWQIHATTDPGALRAWFTQKHEANVSIATGPESGIFVLDVDPRNGGNEAFDALIRKHGPLPAGPQFKTGSGGDHIPFKHPGGYIPTKSNIAPGLDIRGNGGQIIAPPSLHVCGQHYSVDPEYPLDLPVPEAPPWLLALVSSASLNHENDPNSRKPRFNIQEALNGASAGRRDETIFKLAAKMRDEDIPVDMALDWIRRAAQNCDPPFPIKTAEEKVHWAYKKYTPRVDWNREALSRKDPPRHTGRDWVRPYPLGSPTGKPLPEGTFPLWLERFINMIAEEIQVPTSMVATICLSGLAACVAKKGLVRITPSWKESLNLYSVVACPPSSRKSPTFLAVTEPIYDFEERLVDEERSKVALLQSEREGLRLRYNRLMKEFAKSDATTVPQELAALKLRIDELEDIDIPTLIMKDATPEVLSRMLYRNKERMAILASEGKGVFTQMCGKYTGVSDPGVYIDGYSGDPSKVHRIGRASENLKCPTLTLSLAVQPKIMRGVARMEAADQGLLARILYCFPEDNIGHRKIDFDPYRYDPTKLEFETRRVYLDRLSKLLRLSMPEVKTGADGARYDGMNVLIFDDDAREGFLKFEESLEEVRGKECDDNMREWLGKLGGNTARVIALLHLATNIETCENPEDVWKFPIMGPTVEAGVKLGEWFMTHAVAAFEEMQADPIKNYAIMLAKWIRQKQLPSFYKSEAIQCLGGAGGEKTVAALTFLAERGYIRTTGENVSILSRDNIRFDVNPDVLTGDFRSIDEEDAEPDET
jgi:replicative DNA helicase